MKTKCEFCKTEYNVSRRLSGRVRCAVCGHAWVVHAPRRGAFLMILSALCALLAAGVFAAAVVVRDRAADVAAHPLIAEIDSVEHNTDENGAARIVVRGYVLNRSEDIYGMPDLILTAYDDAGAVCGRQKFMPTATLIDAGGRANFDYTMTAVGNNVRRVVATLGESQ